MPTRPKAKSSQEEIPSYFARLTKAPLLSAQEERTLAEEVSKGSVDAKRRLVECNMRLVINLARSYSCNALPLEDLIQEGAIGLMQAIDRYDPSRGFRFSTYATHWIRQAIGRAIDGKSKAIRLPSHVSQTLRRIEQIREEIARDNGAEASVDQIAAEIGLSPIRVRALIQASQDVISLDSKVGDGDSLTLGALIEDPAGANPEYEVLRNEISAELNDILRHLTERERRVVTYRMTGDDGVEGQTVREQLSNELQVSRERIRQIEVLALKKLRAVVLQQNSTRLLHF